MAFEVFSRRNGANDSPSVAGALTVTISKNGLMALSEPVVKLLAAKKVLLLWDAENRRMAIMETGTDDRRSVHLYAMRGRFWRIQAGQFLSWAGFRPEKKITIAATWNEAERMIEFEVGVGG